MRQFSVAMLGFGIAGKAFAKILLEQHQAILEETGFDVQVTAIATGSRGALIDPKGIDLVWAMETVERDGHFDVTHPAYSNLSTMEIVDQAEYDAVLELTPINFTDGQPAISHLEHAMKRGKHAITANKGPMAYAYRYLRDLAKERGVCFFYETTVMAGIPIFDMAYHSLRYCEVREIRAILNATSNYVLRRMEDGLDKEAIYEEGRRGGFMEADPSNDIKGYDAAAKLTALMNVLMDAGMTPADISIKGIEDVTPEDIAAAKARGNKIKLICKGKLVDGKPVGSVQPTEVPENDPFCSEGVFAALTIDTEYLGPITTLQYGTETPVTGYGVFIDVCRVLREAGWQ